MFNYRQKKSFIYQKPYARKKYVNHESGYQVAVIQYLNIKYPNALFTMCPIVKYDPNKPWIGKQIKAMGYRQGTPDILIFEPCGEYHGLFIEMKTPKTESFDKGEANGPQLVFQAEAIVRGYYSCICYGSSEAQEKIDWYFNLK